MTDLINRYFSNTNKRKDFLRNELEKQGKNTEVYIAVAFFTDHKFIQNLLDNGCIVFLIVRLGFPTDPYNLKQIMGKRNIHIRYFSSKRFHPKLYIFGDEVAYIGSSNLTDGGLMANQELTVSIGNEDEHFEELHTIFNDYWNSAMVLTEDILQSYKEITSKYKETLKELSRLDTEITESKEIPFSESSDSTDKPKLTSLTREIDNLQKDYQLFLNGYRELMEIYNNLGYRQVPAHRLPLRLEIHRFINWIKNNGASKGAYLNAPKRNANERKNFVSGQVTKYLNDPKERDFSHTIETYHILNDLFGTVKKIESMNEKELIDGLYKVNAFKERIRQSGKDRVLVNFFMDNNREKVINTLTYLLYGNDDFRTRIARCCVDPEYKLKNFGENSIKELYGWMNKDEVPIYNNRVSHSLQWLGYGRL